MEKTAEDIADQTGLSFSAINCYLSRAEFTKYKYGTKYHVNIDFIDELLKIFEFKRADSKKFEEKYKLAKKGMYEWRRELLKKQQLYKPKNPETMTNT